ncbi:M15 family metallopeptidase [Demequina pelophila]|uniref:M15 family metallopeptidase n=1 Tax=Demequina pelophila TaxID=1638984 RepID=UPI0007864895|nr:M15 family metallopeptidase [Demequina pelophila]
MTTSATPHPARPGRSRRSRRQHHTQQVQARVSHRRRAALTRLGVMLGFVAAMVVYPVMGTVSPYANAAEQVEAAQAPVISAAASTATAILGAAPEFESSDLPLPTVDERAGTVLTSNELPIVSAALPDCDPEFEPATSNGRLTEDQLCDLWQEGEMLRNDAAIALAELNERFRAHFGVDICIADTYRSLSEQYRIKALRGYLAATPGTSMHGMGLAIDLCGAHARGVYYSWLSDNAGLYGYWNPDWAKGSKYEPWHWEFKSGTGDYYQEYWGQVID